MLRRSRCVLIFRFFFKNIRGCQTDSWSAGQKKIGTSTNSAKKQKKGKNDKKIRRKRKQRKQKRYAEMRREFKNKNGGSGEISDAVPQ